MAFFGNTRHGPTVCERIETVLVDERGRTERSIKKVAAYFVKQPLSFLIHRAASVDKIAIS